MNKLRLVGVILVTLTPLLHLSRLGRWGVKLYQRLIKTKQRLREIWGLPEEVKDNAASIHRHWAHLGEAFRELKELVNENAIIHADVHFKSQTQVIVAGRLANRDYVRIFEVDEGFIPDLIKMLEQMEPRAIIGRFDVPYGTPDIDHWSPGRRRRNGRF